MAASVSLYSLGAMTGIDTVHRSHSVYQSNSSPELLSCLCQEGPKAACPLDALSSSSQFPDHDRNGKAVYRVNGKFCF